MVILSCLAGIIIYLTMRTQILNFFELDAKSLKIPLVILLIFIIGLVASITFYNMEIINRNNNDQANYSLYFCATQSLGECQALASEATNQSYAEYLDGRIPKIEVSIPQSLTYQAQRNMGTFFIVGLLLGWIAGVLVSERKS